MSGDGWGTQGTAGASAPTPPPVRRYRAKLNTVGNVSGELARIYREARSGLIPVDHASKYANILSIIARILETSELEARLAKLEAGE
jgi:hypothetical protein